MRTPEGHPSGVLLSGSRNSGRRVAGHNLLHSFGIVIEDRREPAFRLLHRPVFASRVVLDLVALDLADAEIMTLRVAEIEPADGSTRPHRETLGQLHADPL